LPPSVCRRDASRRRLKRCSAQTSPSSPRAVIRGFWSSGWSWKCVRSRRGRPGES